MFVGGGFLYFMVTCGIWQVSAEFPASNEMPFDSAVATGPVTYSTFALESSAV